MNRTISTQDYDSIQSVTTAVKTVLKQFADLNKLASSVFDTQLSEHKRKIEKELNKEVVELLNAAKCIYELGTLNEFKQKIKHFKELLENDLFVLKRYPDFDLILKRVANAETVLKHYGWDFTKDNKLFKRATKGKSIKGRPNEFMHAVIKALAKTLNLKSNTASNREKISEYLLHYFPLERLDTNYKDEIGRALDSLRKSKK